MRPTRPVSTRPGPASTKVRTPAAYMSSIWSTKRTGAATWPARVSRTADASRSYGRAVAPDQTGKAGTDTCAAVSSAASVSRAAASCGLWKAQATGRRRASRPAVRSAATAASTASVGPEITLCSGALWLATTTPAPWIRSLTRAGVAATAAIAPGSSPAAARMASPRRALSRSSVAVS